MIENLSFQEMLTIVREKKAELEKEQSLEPKRANTALTTEIEEFRKMEVQIIRLMRNRIRV